MPKKATKAAGNVYCEARYTASTFNDTLSSREGAAEVCGIERTRLAHFELGTKIPYPEEVMLMADSYNAPELLNWHCTNDCPIGKKTIPKLTLSNADRAIVNFMAAYIELERGKKEIEDLVISVSGDGVLDEKIMPLLSHTAEQANLLAKRAQELSLWAEKNITGKGKND